MAHEFETGFFGSGEAAWHGLGTVIDGQVTSEEAIKLAGLDWKVEKRPLYFDSAAGPQKVDGKVVLVRDKDEMPLGYVSENYTETQNHEAFAFMDTLLGEGVRYESAGALRDGKIIWMLAAMPEDIVIAGDKIRPYAFLTTGHTGHHALKVADTTTRIVCMNTLNLALGDASSRVWKTSHIGDVDAKVREATGVLEFMAGRAELLKKRSEQFLSIKTPWARTKSMLLQMYPDGQNLSDLKRLRNEEKRSKIFRALESEDLANFKWTGWGFLNAVADVVDHDIPENKIDDIAYRENKLLNIAGGHKTLDQAERILLAYN